MARAPLRAGFVPRPSAAYNLPHASSNLFSTLSCALASSVRISCTRGTPFGSERWQLQTAEQLGLARTLRPRGQPRTVKSGELDRVPLYKFRVPLYKFPASPYNFAGKTSDESFLAEGDPCRAAIYMATGSLIFRRLRGEDAPYVRKRRRIARGKKPMRKLSASERKLVKKLNASEKKPVKRPRASAQSRPLGKQKIACIVLTTPATSTVLTAC